MKTDYDIIIVGGGIAGMALACALKPLNLRVALLEAIEKKQQDIIEGDPRALVLSPMSQKIFSTIGVWPELEKHTIPIEHVHISHHKRFAKTSLNASDQDMSALGYVIPMSLLENTLFNATQKSHTDWLCPASLTQLEMKQGIAHCEYQINNQTRTLTSQLVVAADGQHSNTRSLLNIPCKQYDYQQKALVTSIELTREHKNSAYERFTPAGAIAMVPLQGKACKLIWCASNDKIDSLLACDDKAFLQQIQFYFGYRLGKLKAMGKRFAYPLQLIVAKKQVQECVVLLGNAAHAIHPIAAQGYNLAMVTLATLAESIADAAQQNKLSETQWLFDYQKQHQLQQEKIIRFTDTLAHQYTDDNQATALIRDGFIFALEHIGPIKKWFTQKVVSMSGRTPKLACGIPLK